MAPNATRGLSEQYFAPGVSDEFARDLIAFNRQVGAEDDALTDFGAARFIRRNARTGSLSRRQ